MEEVEFTKEEELERYRKAGKILAEVRAEAVKKVQAKASILETANYIEALIREKGALPAFPCNISRNEEAAHATPAKNDIACFKQGDLVKLDIGVHIDGYIADTAITIDLGDNKELVKAAEAGLASAIKTLHAGVSTSEIGEAIEKEILEFGFKPVVNLTGHGLMRYIQHAPPQIPNRKVERGVILKANDVIALEPFATNGIGKVAEGTSVEIYSFIAAKPVRLPQARQLLKEIEPYKTLPFAKRWLHTPRLEMALRQLEAVGAIRGYPVLREETGGLVSQAEHTVIITEDGCEVITI
ncbi:MAG: type II methionyl aminopeptidase [Methanocellales archaeon]